MTKRIYLFLIVLLSASCGYTQAFKAGAALRVLTPDPLLPVSGGIGTPKPATKKEGDLFARALVLESGDVRIAIVSVDNLGWSSILGDRSRALIKGILPENILIAATHTHSGPDAYAFPNEKGESQADLGYLDWCCRQIADAVNEATSRLQAASLKIAVDKAKGKISYNYYADKLFDPRCGVIQAIATAGKNAGKPIATLVNYAVHPEVIGSGRGILSPDLCGPLYEKIESETGGMALFLNGAQGGMVTADNRTADGKEANDYEECKRIGALLASEALRIVSTSAEQKHPTLFCTSRIVTFPVQSAMMKYILVHSPLKRAGASGDSVSTRVNLLNIGSAQILTVPGEALPNIGYYVKRHMRTTQPFLFGLTNDAFGYMLDRVDFDSFERYEYVSRTSLGEETGEIYIDAALRLIGNSPAAAEK